MLKLLPRSARIGIGLGAAAIGFATASLLGSAHANAEARSPASILVPPDGLFFRGTDGRVLARLYGGPEGGVFELYDAQGRPKSPGHGGPLGSRETFASPGTLTAPVALAPPGGLASPMRSASGWATGELAETLADPWAPAR
jgi:hypothetical protein